MTANTNTDLRTGVNGDVGCKYPCRVATVANIELTGTQTINGVAVVEDDIVLVKDQTDSTENGVYVVSTGEWERGVWFNNQLNVAPGSLVATVEGTIRSKTLFQVRCADDPIIFGTSEIFFDYFIASGANVLLASNNLSDVDSTSTSRTNLGVAIGSDVQAYDADLSAVAGLSSTGLITRTGSGTAAVRTITGSNGVAVTNGSGISGNPTLNLDITGLTEDTTPDLTNDFVPTYDVSAATNKKVKIANLCKVYQSTGQTISVAGGLTLAHGLGKAPDIVRSYLQCTSADHSYSVGDVLLYYPAEHSTASQDSVGINLQIDATNITVRFGSQAAGTITLLDKTSGTSTFIDNTKWQFYVRAFLFT